MRYLLLFIIFTLPSLKLFSQEIVRNLDFEQLDFRHLPIGWMMQNKDNLYTITLDTNTANTGKVSVSIALDTSSNKKGAGLFNTGVMLRDFANYKTITINGYIKTENLTAGTASVWMELKTRTAILAGVNSDSVSTEGSNGWKRHSITLPIDPETQYIVFGCKMTGLGKAWFDSLELILD